MKKQFQLLIPLLFIFLFNHINIEAQSTSYLNKKNIFRYQLGIWHPGIYGLKGVAIPSIKNSLSYERLIKKNLSLNFELSRMDMVDNMFDDQQSSNINSYPRLNVIKAKYGANIFDIGMKKYIFRKRSLIAPMGIYLYFGLFYKYERIKSSAIIELDSDYSSDSKLIDTYIANAHDGGLAFGFGNNVVYKQNLILNYEFKFSLPVNAFNQLIGFSNNDIKYPRISNIDTKILMKRQILYNLFTFKIGIGIIK